MAAPPNTSTNNNFVVQNGLTVGNTTIFAGNGDVLTTGNITVSGGGSFGGLNPQQIYNGTTNVTASPNFVNVAISGSNVASFSSTGLTVIGTTTTVNNVTVLNQENANAAVLSYLIGNTSVNNGNIQLTGNIQPSANLAYNIGSPSLWFNSFYGTSSHALYADLAENYVADKVYMSGTVLMFGGANEVTQADADTTRVAGIVSTNPAHLMNGALQGVNITPLALMGRVPCMIIGPVAKGDIMVSAGFGFAKVNNNPVPGQAIGKALEDFASPAKGVIEVVVGRV